MKGVERMARHSPSQFAEWLDITLDNRGISGRNLAELIGVAENAVSRWRTGGSQPSAGNVARMADALDLDRQRLAVTAGVGTDFIPADVKPYPMPEPTAQRDSVRRQIARIKGLTEDGREALLKAYDEMIMKSAEET